MTNNFLAYYDAETYLFGDVRERFYREGKLDALDLFSIIIWKANRAKSRIARRLIRRCGDLETAASEFTRALFNTSAAEERDRRIRLLFEASLFGHPGRRVFTRGFDDDRRNASRVTRPRSRG